MRLITHNVLQCNIKNCTSNNFPLLIENAQIEQISVEFNPNFLVNFISRLDWAALKNAARQVRFIIWKRLISLQ
jgi:multifunctional methyltransferase subunit TRM112